MAVLSRTKLKSSQNKEAYYTASQAQLIWARFRKNRSAMVAAFVLLFFILLGLFAPFISPYKPTIEGKDDDYLNGAPQILRFWDENGFSVRPFTYTVERTRSAATNFRWVETINKEERRYLQWFVKGWEYYLLNIFIDLPGRDYDLRLRAFKMDMHLFGMDTGFIHLFGTDREGKDIFGRTVHAVGVSLAIGTVGVLLSFVLALIIGGIAGYFGGWIDRIIQVITDAVRVVPTIPLYMAIASFLPDDWGGEARFFFISIVLGLLGWPTLARRIRTHLLAERTQDYVLAAQLAGARANRIIRRHLLPSFTSYIIVDLVITFPYTVLAETALSFIGLGLKDPVNSIGVLLKNATSVDVMLNYQWQFIPVPIFVILVLAFVFVGDGLRDAADPYQQGKK